MTDIKLNNPASIFRAISIGFLVSVFSMFYSFYLEISPVSFPVDLCDIYMDGFVAIYNCPFWHPQSELWRPMVSILSVIIILAVLEIIYRYKLKIKFLTIRNLLIILAIIISLNFIYFIFWSYQSSKYIIDV